MPHVPHSQIDKHFTISMVNPCPMVPSPSYIEPLPSTPVHRVISSCSLIGSFQDIKLLLMERLRFSVSVTFAPDGKFGKPPPNNASEWKGLAGLLKRREVDLVSAGMGITLGRSLAFDYTVPIMEHRKTLIASAEKVKFDLQQEEIALWTGVEGNGSIHDWVWFLWAWIDH